MPSNIVTAPTCSFFQSSSVFGTISTTLPLGWTMVLTESNTKSDAGSIMYSISSLTDTIGFMSPMSGVVFAMTLGAGAGGGVADFEGEQDDANKQKTRTARRMCATF